MAEVSSSDQDERLGRSRIRDDKEHRRSKKRRRKHSSASPSDSSSSDSGSSSSDESSDEERRRRDRKRRKEKKKKTHDKSDKEKSREERHKDKKKRKKKRHRSDDSDDSYDSDAEKKRRLLKEAKKLLRKHKLEQKSNGDNGSMEAKSSSGKVVKVPDEDKISEDHYFVKSNEFATWLREEQRIFFSDLSSEETHKRFLKFVDVWNAGKLSHKYYEGIKQAPRTNHNWAIKRGPEDSVNLDEEEQYAVAKKKDRLDRKKFQKDHEALLDDILPKATGRERQMEMKAIRREQARAREDSPELMKEKDVMGGGEDFQSRLAREKARREKRQYEKAAVYSEKRSAFEEKEAAAMDQLRALVNVAGGKITIAKRESNH
ncbi:hypothetical protein MPTK1_3g14060 [Marchantia polymorpha subsp. ruderalis]|uniref:Uncharacterized protein n=2 Tax=Marchantia polymorpha TaxID=3197 RepID=A0A176VV60_MARPO|nr:hypothetical protein AXG93_2601s1110 [Marchantia polymorpha subsp. ruderalis]PTQ49038.1 hypothetical protein MARPO_0004s0265 [Marchantia polymorpha]BBN05546.1 hypothetical protein Mp_3g14060 [Marchantia polymorpha subsp. ruderalis]|eukprot:PTQ49038.1 hypothetical protein MARPO_0004s0265 [Marchantia polymorpha]